MYREELHCSQGPAVEDDVGPAVEDDVFDMILLKLSSTHADIASPIMTRLSPAFPLIAAPKLFHQVSWFSVYGHLAFLYRRSWN